MNTVTITGNLTDTPSSGSTGAGTKYCRFAVAVSRKVRKDGTWEDKLDGYFKVVAWRTLAESCSKLEKGTRVQIILRRLQHNFHFPAMSIEHGTETPSRNSTKSAENSQSREENADHVGRR